ADGSLEHSLYLPQWVLGSSENQGSSAGMPICQNMGAHQLPLHFSTPNRALSPQVANHVAFVARTPVPFTTQTVSTSHQTPVGQQEGTKGVGACQVLLVHQTRSTTDVQMRTE
ncbi:hypothetical protein CROQUDRAFT_665042, partial [Cronartium quercuum f. sp. fusiforme G11]